MKLLSLQSYFYKNSINSKTSKQEDNIFWDYSWNLIYPKTLQLESGSDLLNSLQALATKENKSGYILSVVGNLSIAKFQCPGKRQATTVKDHLEIIGLNGTISPNKCHLHISLSDGECKVWAGHLEEGTIIPVSYTHLRAHET